MKLPCTNPCRSKLASHRLSFGSVFFPRSAFTCSGFAKMIFKLPSKMLNTGFQYEPVLSITASVHPLSSSHVRNRSNSFTLVPNRRTSPTGFWFASPIKTQTAKNLFPTSIPAHFSTLTSSMASPFEERPTPSSSFCLAGLIAPIGGSFVVGQTTFLTGWFPPFFNRPFLFVHPILRSNHPAVKRNSFILGGGPQGHESFLSAVSE